MNICVPSLRDPKMDLHLNDPKPYTRGTGRRDGLQKCRIIVNKLKSKRLLNTHGTLSQIWFSYIVSMFYVTRFVLSQSKGYIMSDLRSSPSTEKMYLRPRNTVYRDCKGSVSRRLMSGIRFRTDGELKKCRYSILSRNIKIHQFFLCLLIKYYVLLIFKVTNFKLTSWR